MTTIINPSNYLAIEQAIGNLITANLGFAVEYGDFSKLLVSTPLAVVEHASLKSSLSNRAPNFEDFDWYFPIHFAFDYQSDTEAHNLMREIRSSFLSTFIRHKQLDDGNTNTYPAGIAGQALNSKITRATLPFYFTLDGRDFAAFSFELLVRERIFNTWP